MAECIPHRLAPGINRFVTRWSRGDSKYVGNGLRASVGRQCEDWPELFPSREIHMHSLDLPPRKLLLDVQVKADERERQLDRFRPFIRILRGKGIDDMLVNKRRIAMGKRVVTEFVVSIL